MKYECGLKKWTIGIDDDEQLTIKLHSDPIYGEVKLHDVTVAELRALAEMFTLAAHARTSNSQNKS